MYQQKQNGLLMLIQEIKSCFKFSAVMVRTTLTYKQLVVVLTVLQMFIHQKIMATAYLTMNAVLYQLSVITRTTRRLMMMCTPYLTALQIHDKPICSLYIYVSMVYMYAFVYVSVYA